MLLSVVTLVILTAVVAATLLAPRLLPRHVHLDAVPDAPRSFGSEMSWLAVRTDDATRLMAALGLTDLRPANWNSGIGAIYDPDLSDTCVFVSPAVKGWTFVAGIALPLPSGASFIDKTTPLLQRLASEFSSVQYFATFPIIDFYAWARYDDGRSNRAFAIGDAGVVWDGGRLTPSERRLGLSLIEFRGIRGREGDVGGALDLHPTEQHVLSIAAAWSIDPMSVDRLLREPGAGWVARVPQTWRAQRYRDVA